MGLGTTFEKGEGTVEIGNVHMGHC
jgi:hypothetical protein